MRWRKNATSPHQEKDASKAVVVPESWISIEDDRLWSICRKPNNKRFMIYCDSCVEWIHGKCVGVTRGQGQIMEMTGQGWYCCKCVDGWKRMAECTSELETTSMTEHDENIKDSKLNKKKGNSVFDKADETMEKGTDPEMSLKTIPKQGKANRERREC